MSWTVKDNSGFSSRGVACRAYDVRKVLCEQILYPYHLHRDQCLMPSDFQALEAFFWWFLQQCVDPSFIL